MQVVGALAAGLAAGVLALARAASAQAAIRLVETGPYNCGGREQPAECQVQLVGGPFAPFDAADAPAGHTTVTLAGVTSAAAYRNVIRKIEKAQEAGARRSSSPPGATTNEDELALATVLLTDAGEVFVDESLDSLRRLVRGSGIHRPGRPQGIRQRVGAQLQHDVGGGGAARSDYENDRLPGPRAPHQPAAESQELDDRARRRIRRELRTGRIVGRGDCPGYYGPEAEVVPQPLNPWPFL